MRKLTLKKETLAELTAAELAHVIGGAPTVGKLCEGPTLSLTCTSAVDACITAQAC
jgi:bacteriocin-like protein